jgi:hypothetical protein
MRQLAHIFYAMVFLMQGSSETTVDLIDYQRRFWMRDVGLADSHAKTAFGMFHWEQLRDSGA